MCCVELSLFLVHITVKLRGMNLRNFDELFVMFFLFFIVFWSFVGTEILKPLIEF